jgi:tetratricopeptide (TPR) repeat protein
LFKEALDRAVEVEDKETESKVLLEIGKIYDKNDYLAQALTSYNKSLQAAGDDSVKTQAHYSMAQIYDDIAQFEPAINHYMSSISYAGETENLVAQSTSLAKIGGIYSDKYQKEAFDFLLEAEVIAKESKNSKAKGYVSSNLANTYDRFNEPQNALKYYSSAVKEYDEAGVANKVAINYKRASELMQTYDNPIKARSLMEKALTKARQTDDVQLMKEIHEALGRI